MVKKEYKLEGLACTSCATKIEAHMNKLDSVSQVQINLVTQTLTLYTGEDEDAIKDEQVKKIVLDVEPNIIIEKIDKGIVPLESKQEITISHYIFWVGVILAAISYVLMWLNRPTIFLYLTAYGALGYKVVWTALVNIVKGRLLDEKFLMAFATISAFALGQYPEAVGVMLFYEIGNRLENLAVQRSRRSITSLLDLKPTIVHLIKDTGIFDINPNQVEVGNKILVKPGERIPLDGTILKGETYVDQSAITGESIPVYRNIDSEVLSGSVNLNQAVELQVTNALEDSFVSRILTMVQDASAQKSHSENMITRLAIYYTPIVVGLAVLLAIVPPVILHEAFHTWFYRALVFLVISCPCALVISIPLAFFGGIGAASRHGILIKGGNYLEALREVDTVVFDKTGTLTTGKLRIRKISPIPGLTELELLETAAYADSYSNHPIAQAIRNAYGKGIDNTQIDSYEEKPGLGAVAVWDDVRILAGNDQLLINDGIAIPSYESTNTIIHIAAGGRYLGFIEIGDELRPDVANIIAELRRNAIKRIIMLSGDRKDNVHSLAKQLGFDEYYAELLPQDKLAKMDELVNKSTGKVAFIGDGINDAPVLMRADIGIAMGGIGSDAAIQAADVVFMRDDLKRMKVARNISNYTNMIVWQNIFFALGVKALIMGLGSLGYATLWAAVFADVGVALIAVLNSIRILRNKRMEG
jgi:Zn2+/Cd2+-exporting ATPase